MASGYQLRFSTQQEHPIQRPRTKDTVPAQGEVQVAPGEAPPRLRGRRLRLHPNRHGQTVPVKKLISVPVTAVTSKVELQGAGACLVPLAVEMSQRGG